MEMTTALLTVGIDPWEANTLRLVESLQKHEPDVQLVVVDAAADPPYPAYRYVYRLDERPSGFAAGLNVAASLTDADWMVMVNNDTEITAPFTPMLAELPPGVYGNYMMFEAGRKWLDGWVMAIHREVWQAVGEWDENFRAGAFEDADYCWRAEKLGYPVEDVGLPIIHHEAHSRFTNSRFWTVRQENFIYLWNKHP